MLIKLDHIPFFSEENNKKSKQAMQMIDFNKRF